MNKDSKSSLVVVIMVLALVFSGLLYIYLRSSRSQTPTPSVVDQTVSETTGGLPQKGDLNYQEPDTTIVIGSEGVSKGTFEKVEDENIFLRTDANTLTQIPLTSDEIAVTCTGQDLSTATEIDFNQVSKVEVTTPSGLAGLIPANESIVVFAQDVEGVNRVHTVAVDATRCSL